MTTHTPTPDNSTLRAPTAEEAHDMLMLRSVGAMTIAEGDEGWRRVPLDCPMLVAVSALRNSHDALVAALTSATVMLEAIEAHCVNERGLKGVDHADDGRRGRAAMQAIIPELHAALKAAKP